MDFKANNSLDILNLYQERKKYKELVYTYLQNNPIDFLYESGKYALRNDDNETVYLLVDNTTRASLRQFPFSDQEGAIFFVSAFEDFRDHFLEKIRTSRLPQLPGLDELTVKKGFTNFSEKYSMYLSGLKGFLLTEFLVDYKIYNFSDFINAMDDFIRDYAKDFSLTRSGFIESKNCSVHISGLVADLSDEDCSRDSTKNSLLKSPTFQCYLESAELFGLSIDKNAPWRLVANLESPEMRKYILRYGTESMTTRQILDFKFYTKPHFDDMNDMQDFFYSTYKDLVVAKPFEVEYTGNIRKYIEREPLVYWFDEEKYDSRFWLERLLKVRMLECNIALSQQEHQAILADIFDTLKVYGLKSAMGLIGQKIAQNRPKAKKIESFKSVKLKHYL